MVKYGLKNGKCVTVKAEDRPSGSAGDSASVSTPLFRISVELSFWRVLVCAAKRRSRIKTSTRHGCKIYYIVIWFIIYFLEKEILVC
jgi:hypothetical protein